MTQQLIKYTPRKYLSVSTLVSFARCPRRYFYSKCGLVQDEEPLAPEYGTAMHAAVPVALETCDIKPTLEAFMSVWEPFEAKQDELEFRDRDSKRNRACATRTLQHFIHTHQGERSLYKLLPAPSGALQKEDKTSDYEVPWALDVGLPVPLVGRFDAFARHRDTNETYILEVKTTSRLNAQFFEAHEMSPQNLVYALVGQTILGTPVTGVMIEGIHVHDKKVENMTHPIPVPPHHIEAGLRWIRELGTQLLACERHALELESQGLDPAGGFFQDFSGCTPYPFFYMPGYRCEYADMCRVPDWRSLTQLYKVRPDHDFLNPSGLVPLRIDPSAERSSIPSSDGVSNPGTPSEA